MNVIIFSDNHGYLPKLNKCDLVIIAGDITPASDHSINWQKHWIVSVFIPWVNNLDCDKVILVPGNHDFVFDQCEHEIKEIIASETKGKLTVLIHEEYIYHSNDGGSHRIFGTPYCKLFYNWAFMKESDSLQRVYDQIPENLDILICHDTPNIAKQGLIRKGPWMGTNAGNKNLALTIYEKKPKIVFHGHIHSGSHIPLFYNGTYLQNVSIMDDNLNQEYQPLELVIENYG